MFKKTPLLDGETIILEDYAYYLWGGWIGTDGKLFLTNMRVVFCPSRLAISGPWRWALFLLIPPSPKHELVTIMLSEIKGVHFPSGLAAIGRWARLKVRAENKVHEFSFGFYGAGKPKRWITALEERLYSAAA